MVVKTDNRQQENSLAVCYLVLFFAISLSTVVGVIVSDIFGLLMLLVTFLSIVRRKK